MDQLKFPDYIESRISYGFLLTFKLKLDAIFNKELEELHDCVATYCNFYQWCDLREGWVKALKATCIALDFEELYIYIINLNYLKRDIMQGYLTELLYKLNVIQYGNEEESMTCPFNQ